ncbi:MULTISPECIES: hypothetical protein [unclassified Streptomyces]|uniref:hypothetical protein n=1 Tax=unclassified Streptomyces TaxID=2593676 RepID=UPI00131A3362|nr:MULTISPECIES: hypothetical protein [unclassified Streptomyces]MYT27370.1 hypothetical protein [Streptomyces sp. SID8354]
MGHVLTRRIIGQPDDAVVDIARYLQPSDVQVTDGVVSDYSGFVEHITPVLRGTLLALADTEPATPIGAGEVVERLAGARRTEGAR